MEGTASAQQWLRVRPACGGRSVAERPEPQEGEKREGVRDEVSRMRRTDRPAGLCWLGQWLCIVLCAERPGGRPGSPRVTPPWAVAAGLRPRLTQPVSAPARPPLPRHRPGLRQDSKPREPGLAVEDVCVLASSAPGNALRARFLRARSLTRRGHSSPSGAPLPAGPRACARHQPGALCLGSAAHTRCLEQRPAHSRCSGHLLNE